MTTQSSNSTAQGGFLHGIPQAEEILTEGTASSGCCGATSQATTSGCCGEPLVSTTGATSQASGCCGEPVSGSSSAPTGCCN